MVGADELLALEHATVSWGRKVSASERDLGSRPSGPAIAAQYGQPLPIGHTSGPRCVLRSREVGATPPVTVSSQLIVATKAPLGGKGPRPAGAVPRPFGL